MNPDTTSESITTVLDATYADLETIREQAPLIHNITNMVVMPLTANALLSIGASPVMAHAEEELAEIISLARAAVINIGTLDNIWMSSMRQAVALAAKKPLPLILDPVGAGASQLRTQFALALLATKSITCLRGNAAEIMALAGDSIQSKGVDSTYATEAAVDAARYLNQEYGCVVAISGARDIILFGDKEACCDFGAAMMTKVTGMGCTATALIGAFAAVNANAFKAAQHAMLTMSIAGELAASRAAGPGSLKMHFLDTLYHLSAKDFRPQLESELELQSCL